MIDSYTSQANDRICPAGKKILTHANHALFDLHPAFPPSSSSSTYKIRANNYYGATWAKSFALCVSRQSLTSSKSARDNHRRQRPRSLILLYCLSFSAACWGGDFSRKERESELSGNDSIHGLVVVLGQAKSWPKMPFPVNDNDFDGKWIISLCAQNISFQKVVSWNEKNRLTTISPTEKAFSIDNFIPEKKQKNSAIKHFPWFIAELK